MLGDGSDVDVIALAEDPLEVAVQVFYVRGGRIRGQRGWVADRVEEGGTPELVEDFLLQLYAGELATSIPTEILVPALPPGRRRRSSSCSATCAAAGSQIRVPQRGDKKTLQETVARNAARGAGAAQDQAGQRPDHPQPGARGDPAGARARRGAAAHRVLRRLQPPGHRGGGVDGGLRGRPGPQERVPPLRDQGRRRPERRRLDARGDHPAVPAAARRAGQVRAQARATTESGPMLVDPETGRPRKFAYAPGLVVVDGGPPQVAAAQRALDELGIDDIPVVRPGQAARGGVAARPGGPGHPAPLVRGALPAPADPRRGAPVRDHPPPLAAVQVDGREPARRRARASARCAARRCSSTSARSRSCARPRSTTSPRCPASGPRPPPRSRTRWPRRTGDSPDCLAIRVNTATGEIEDS